MIRWIHCPRGQASNIKHTEAEKGTVKLGKIAKTMSTYHPKSISLQPAYVKTALIGKIICLEDYKFRKFGHIIAL